MTKAPLKKPKGFIGAFDVDFATRCAYSEGAGPYRIVPSAVAVPRDTHDLQQLLAFAHTHGLPLIPRGAGSAMPGNNVGRGVVVDLTEFNRPLAVSVHREANVGAAVTWHHLDEAAAIVRLRLPPNPSSGAFCTLGGMAATNAAGPNSLRYGSIRRWIRGLEFLTADGERGWLQRGSAGRSARTASTEQRKTLDPKLAAIERFRRVAEPKILAEADGIAKAFPRTSKNAAGYALDQFIASGDLLDLIIGSEGTLGFITRLELELQPRPRYGATALLAVRDIDDVADIVHDLVALDPTAVELLDRTLLSFANIPDMRLDDVDAVLLVDLERSDANAARDAAKEAVAVTRSKTCFVRIATSESQRRLLWDVRHAASPTLAALSKTRRVVQIIEDGCVPVDRFGEYLRGVRNAAHSAGVDIVAFGHAGDGHLHVNALVDCTRHDFGKRLATLLDETTDLVMRLGGTISGEHGDGRLRGPLLERLYGRDIVSLFTAVKAAFDPRGILNPGVIVGPFSGGPLDDLKLGEAAESIPDDVAAALYRVEREAGWGASKRRLVAMPQTVAPGGGKHSP